MILLPEIRTNLLKVINFIILFDLVFGGSGRVIVIGGISLRTMLFGFVVLITVVYRFINESHFETTMFLMIAYFILYLVINVLFVGNEPFGIKFDFLSRYLYLIMVFFYEIYFMHFGVENTVAEIRSMFEILTFVFALFSILLWMYALTLGYAAYGLIEMRFFRPYVYGSFDFIGPGLPRIFMKSSIFLPVGLMFHLDHLIDKRTVLNLFRCMVYAIAIITTFTSGFFLATAVCCLILFQRKHILSGSSSLFFIVLIGAGIFIISRSGLISLMLNRYTGDYTTSYRMIQLSSIIREFMKKPLLGHGFGHEFTTFYGNTVRTTSGFEIAYGETLVDTGIIGFSLYISIIILAIKRLMSYAAKNSTFDLFAIGLILICLESCTNPFINNSIGLTFFAICAGMGNAAVRNQSTAYGYKYAEAESLNEGNGECI